MGTDVLLSCLVRAVNEGAPEVPIVLLVQGTVVSGTLARRDDYLATLRTRDDLATALAAYETVLHALDPAELPGLFQVRGATVRRVGERDGMAVDWWHGKLTAVDGFTLPGLSEPGA
jgi:hypothetical protein